MLVKFNDGVYVLNYSDKPDWKMQEFIDFIRNFYDQNFTVKNESFGLRVFKKKLISRIRIPERLGLVMGLIADVVGMVFGKSFTISSVRIQKFCSNSIFSSEFYEYGFVPKFNLNQSIERTIRHEFIRDE